MSVYRNSESSANVPLWWTEGVSAAIDTASDLDRIWFETNKNRRLYCREPFPSEWGTLRPVDPDEALIVFVVRLNSNLRARLVKARPRREVARLLRAKESRLDAELERPSNEMWCPAPPWAGGAPC